MLVINDKYFLAGTPRLHTRKTSGMYDSDRASNGMSEEHLSLVKSLSDCNEMQLCLHNFLALSTDSGNSSDESEGEDAPEKKPEWAETTDPATARKQEEEEEKEEERKVEKERMEAAKVEQMCPTIPQEKLQLLDGSELEKPEEDMVMSPDSDEKSPKSRAKRARQREPGSETLIHLPASTNHTESEGPGSFPRLARKPQDSEHISPTEQVPLTTGSDTDSATEDIGPPERSCVAKRKATEHWTPDKKIRLEHKEEPKTLSPEKVSDTERPMEEVREMEDHLAPPVPAEVAPPEETEVKTEMPALTKEVQIRVENLSSFCPMKEVTSAITDEEMMPQIGPEALVCHEVDLDDPEEKEKPSREELLVLREEKTHAPNSAVAQVPPQQPSFHLPSSLTPAAPPQLCSPSSAPSPDESHSTKSESDATIEADSMAESHEGLGENFDASASSSNSSISLQERDSKDKGWCELPIHFHYAYEMLRMYMSWSPLIFELYAALGQKRLHDCNSGSSAKKQKRNQKRLGSASAAEKNGAGRHSFQRKCVDVDLKDHPLNSRQYKLRKVVWIRLFCISEW